MRPIGPMVAIVVLAFALRVAWLDMKPAHFDEGVNGWFVDAMTQQGYYAYDPTNFHGPLHYYLLFVSQTLFGRSLWALRMPLVLVSTASVALVFAFRRWLGTGACLLAALAMAISPGAVFYGRYAIHEAEFVFCLMLATWGLIGLRAEGTRAQLWALGLGLTGAVLTKETYVVHFAAFGLVWLALALRGGGWKSWPQCLWPAARQWTARDAGIVATVGSALVVFFYSGGFLHWESLPGLWLTFAPWLATGTGGASGHEKEWWYWLELLGRYEWPALAALCATPWLARRRPGARSSAGFQPVGVAQAALPARETHEECRLEACATPTGKDACATSTPAATALVVLSLATFAVYSAIAYKTPWCLISLMWPLHLLFGVAVARAARDLDRWLATLVAVVTLGMSLGLTLELNFHKCTDEEEPYVYVQTLPDIEKLLHPLRTLVARDPMQRHLVGQVVMAEIHPLPWLLGDFTHVDFPAFDELPESLDAAFLLIDELLAEDIEPRLRHEYFREPLRLRGQSDGAALLYLREEKFRAFFPARVPEFVPEP